MLSQTGIDPTVSVLTSAGSVKFGSDAIIESFILIFTSRRQLAFYSTSRSKTRVLVLFYLNIETLSF